ncbi:GGGtGRT protein [Vibrio chagasii]|nr:GGGtGRT protein [Vibrio chagasii]
MNQHRCALAEMNFDSLAQAEQYCATSQCRPKNLGDGHSNLIAFESAADAYTQCQPWLYSVSNAEQAANIIGVGLQAFTKPGSVAEQRHRYWSWCAKRSSSLNEGRVIACFSCRSRVFCCR